MMTPLSGRDGMEYRPFIGTCQEPFPGVGAHGQGRRDGSRPRLVELKLDPRRRSLDATALLNTAQIVTRQNRDNCSQFQNSLQLLCTHETNSAVHASRSW